MAMRTQTPIVHHYTEINEGKYKSVKHFELTRTENGTPELSDLINISKDRNCAQSMPEFWLQIREGNKWKKPRLTGLFKTEIEHLYKGDSQKKRNLIIFKFSDTYNHLVVYYFKNYFTKDLREVYSFLNL